MNKELESALHGVVKEAAKYFCLSSMTSELLPLKIIRDLDAALPPSANSPLRGRFADVGCKACTDLHELFVSIPVPSNRQYWLMTELFLKLHNGSDVCPITKKTREPK